ncbi:MAG: hypothetical protein SFW35_12925 [Chitinophagales bacterium]|nr:hypothetical protein [Chitinophagales bacterium]
MTKTPFVTVLAIIMLLFSSIGLLISLAYNVAIRFFFTQDKFNAMLDQYGISLQAPTLESVYSALSTILLVALIFYVLRLAMAIALLRRKNWSRIAHMVYFVFALFAYLFVFAILVIAFFFGDQSLNELKEVSSSIQSIGFLAMASIIVFCAIYIAGLVKLSGEKAAIEFKAQ